MTKSVRTLILIWLGWSIAILAFQGIVNARYQPNRPDRALMWTPNETARNSQNGKDFLLEPFMNHQVSWDSEFYVGIAVGGYDDPRITTTTLKDGSTLPLSYAFFPFYPFTISLLAAPLGLLGLNPIAAASLGGVLASLFGTLGAMLALYDITRHELGDEGGIRVAYYMLVFPSGFFLAQVYTEGVFLGLALGSIAFAYRKQFFWAALLAALATLTKAVGLLLLVPLFLAWLDAAEWRTLLTRLGESFSAVVRQDCGLGFLILTVLAFLFWHFTLGEKAVIVEHEHFGRGLFNWGGMAWGLDYLIGSFREGSNPQMTTYYALEVASILLALTASVFTFRRYPGLTLFGLLAFTLAVTGSAPQSIIRYVLTVPAVFILLARLGRSAAFDRTWTLLSVLLLAMQATLFTFDMWVA